MKVGDKVIITTEKKYAGAVLGQIGEIVKIYSEGSNIAVKINTMHNQASKEGLFYFTEDELKPMLNDDVGAIKLTFNSLYSVSALKNVFAIPNNVYGVPEIKNVKFSGPATIVFWSDNTKTIVKAHEESFDPEKGLAMAICKKLFGNTKEYYYKLKHWTKKYKGE